MARRPTAPKPDRPSTADAAAARLHARTADPQPWLRPKPEPEVTE